MFRRWIARSAVVTVALVAAVMSLSSAVAAHTDFESSTPSDGAVVDQRVGEIVIRFTAEATPAGEGFTVLDPTGVLRTPSTVTTEDDKVFVLGFDPPLAGGQVGVRWMVRAGDAHPIEGSFAFTVAAPATTTPATTAAPAAPATIAPAATTGPETTAAPSTTEDTSVEATAEASAGLSQPDDGSSEAGVSLEEFLATESSTPGEGRQLVGRIVSYLGVIGAIGGLAFLASTLLGRRDEIDMMLTAVAGLGVLTAVGASTEYWGWLAESDGTVFGEMTSTPGVAMTLRIAGGLALAAALATAVWRTSGPDRQQKGVRPLSASVLVETDRLATAAEPGRRWDPRSTPLAWVGAALLVVSFWFDGHTVSEGPRVVHAAVNSAHLVAAAVWVGGVVSLLAVLVTRHRRDEPSRSADLIVRFSSIATVALAAVVLAGAVMAVFVLDSPGDLTSTEWGRTLLLKTAAVGLAALGGAYNHFRLRPQLEAAPDDARLRAEFRSTLTAEAIVLTFVVVTTAWLVVAAT